MKQKILAAVFLAATTLTACGTANIIGGGNAASNVSLSSEEDGTKLPQTEIEKNKTEETGMEEMVPVSYHCDKGSIGLSIPKDWEYQITEYGKEGDYFAIEIHPETQAQGTIVIQYTEAFGVCGTGLEEKEYSQNGMPARIGIYDNHPYWDFMVFKDDYEGYVILNNAGETWWMDYKDLIENILKTLVIGNK